MFELLPKTRRRTIQKEYLMRYVSVACWVLSGVMFAWIVLLVPSIYVTYMRSEFLEEQQSVISQNEESQRSETASAAVDAVVRVANTSARNPSVIIEDVLLQTGSVEITAVTISKNKDSFVYSATFNGIAPNRNGVVNFADRVRSISYVKTVDVPVSSLVKEFDVPFTLSLTTTDLPFIISGVTNGAQ